MKIKEVKISNILSFPYVKNFKNMQGVGFYSEESSYDGLKILIGDNASGKSNFINIIDEFFSTLVKNFFFSQENVKKNIRKVIIETPNFTKKIGTNYNTPDQKAKVEFLLKISNNDYDNIRFICKNTQKINRIIDKYSKINFRFPEYKFDDIIEKKNTIRINANFNEKKQSFIIQEKYLEEYEKFIINCFRYHELLQIIITIHNYFEKKEDQEKWLFLKNTFAIVNNDRTKIQYNNFINPFEIINSIDHQNNSLSGYIGCIQKIRNILENAEKINTEQKEIEEDTSTSSEKEEKKINAYINNEKLINNILKESSFFKSLYYVIKKYFRKELTINYINGTINFYFKDDTERIFYFNDFSDGEKSLLSIIFGFYGNDLSDGFIIINEPELHLHPYIQKELTKVCNQVGKNLKTQFIICTNSPLFINEKNITNVYRVYKENRYSSKILSLKIDVDYEDTTLLHMLRFENLSKIFFVDKIILVEGDSDMYFFNYYLQYLQGQEERKNTIKDYEIININGKGSLRNWRKFLNKFEIENHFIGDRDNTVDFGFFSRQEINKYYQLANKVLVKTNKNKQGEYKDYYNKLVKAILTFNPKKHKAIIQGINKLYDENIYILKEGAIESYVPLEKKGLLYIVNFCNNNFCERIKNEHFSKKREEIEGIIAHIFLK